jgi:hypothetical protein
MSAANELVQSPSGPLAGGREAISHVEVAPLHPAQVRRLDGYAGAEVPAGRLARLCRAGGVPGNQETLRSPRHDQAMHRGRIE